MKVFSALEGQDFGLLKRALEAEGPEGIALENSESDLEAVQKVYLHRGECALFLDLDNPAVIGLATVEALRRQDEMASLPIVVLSAENREEEAREAGATLFLGRPLSTKVLADAFQRAVSAEGGEGVGHRVNKVGPENRKAVRRDLETACIISTLGQKHKGIVRDISLSGAQVNLDADLPMDSLLTLIIGIPGSVPLKIVQFKARVVRRSDQGFGLAFRQMDPSTRSFVLAYTQKEDAT